MKYFSTKNGNFLDICKIKFCQFKFCETLTCVGFNHVTFQVGYTFKWKIKFKNFNFPFHNFLAEKNEIKLLLNQMSIYTKSFQRGAFGYDLNDL